MDMININSGNLRAIGYEAKSRTLRVELAGGTTLEYAGISDDLWRRFKHSGAQWSFYRDNIEEEFTATRVSGKPAGGQNSLDDLFKL